MKHRCDKAAALSFLKDRVWIWLMVFALSLFLFFVLFRKQTAYTREEQLNFAVTVFAYHDEGKEEELLQKLSGYGIREVNLSYYDISDPAGLAGYLATYGCHQADILILDLGFGYPLLADCFRPIPEEQAAALGLQPVLRDGVTVGLLLHDPGNEAYNAQLAPLHEWLLFGAEGSEYPYGLFLNIDSVHADIFPELVNSIILE